MSLKYKSFAQQLTPWIRMEVMMEMFREKFVTPEQRQLAVLVKQKGGGAAIRNDQVMKELVAKEASISAPVGSERQRSTKMFDLVEIQREIQSDPQRRSRRTRSPSMASSVFK